MSKDLVPVTQETWQMIQSIAPVAQASRMFGVTQEQAAIVMLKGHELGLGVASAFEYIHVIDSKPSLAPKGALALIHQSGELAKMRIQDEVDTKGNPTACTVYMERKNGFGFEVRFSMEDAKRAGLVKTGSGWDKYPANMLRWRAVGYCADVVFSDVTGGMYRPEELGANVDTEGAPIETDWKVVEKPAGEPPTQQEATFKTLNDLLAVWTAEQVMSANEGQIPATGEDFERIAATLKAAEFDVDLENIEEVEYDG